MTLPRWQRESVDRCVERLGVSKASAELFHASDVVDLHVDSFIWQRIFGYRLDRRHTEGILHGRFARHVDLPRLREVGLTGATWVITTNPLRPVRSRGATFSRNLDRLEQSLTRHDADVEVVKTEAAYRNAVSSGRHAAFLGVQGGNAFAADLSELDRMDPQRILRVTLSHLTPSHLAQTSAPFPMGRPGLTAFGAEVVRILNQKKIFVDLAHIDRPGFFEALATHDHSLPPIVTHTGISGVRPHWRNLDDEQIRAIADRGGTIGIMYHSTFLTKGFRRCAHEAVVDHVEYVTRLVGDDFVSLGSDWDGAITTPHDMRTCLELPRLVETMLRRGFPERSVQKILGGNFLRVLKDFRG